MKKDDVVKIVIDEIERERIKRLKEYVDVSNAWHERVFAMMDRTNMTSDDLVSKGYIEPLPPKPYGL